MKAEFYSHGSSVWGHSDFHFLPNQSGVMLKNIPGPMPFAVMTLLCDSMRWSIADEGGDIKLANA